MDTSEQAKKNIVILGGGISGMAAAILCWLSLPFKGFSNNIKMITKDLEGEFNKGGLKYLHNDPITWKFLSDLGYESLPSHPKVKKIVGALALNFDIVSYPDYFWFQKGSVNSHILGAIQRTYWKKTRGVLAEFEKSCMNNPHLYGHQLAIDLDHYHFICQMKDSVKTHVEIIYKDIDADVLRDVMSPAENSDLIIYTLPINQLYEAVMNKEFELERQDLYIYNIFTRKAGAHVWWDYCYIPQPEYPFHRISARRDSGYLNLQLEVNASSGGDPPELQDVDMGFKKFNKQHLGIKRYEFDAMQDVLPIKGQIVDKGDNDLKEFYKRLPKNVKVAGRYAEWGSRVTFNKTLDSLYQIIKDTIKEWS